MYPIDFFSRASRNFRDRLAIDAPDEQLTYGELAARVNALAAALQDMAPEDSRVGVCAGNSVAHIVAILAVLAAGKTWIPLNPRNAVVELDRVVEFTNPSVVLTMAGYGEKMQRTADVRWIGLDGLFTGARDTIADLLLRYRGQQPKRLARSDDDIQAIKFTGGSTGLPKGVMQPYRAWRATVVNLIDAYGFDENSRSLVAAPITHGASTYLLPVLAKGGCHVLLKETTPQSVLDALANKGVTSVFMPPTLFYTVMEVGAGGTWRFPALKHLIYGGAPMPVDKIRQAQKFFGPVVGVTYGQTESPQIVTFMTGMDLMKDENVQAVGRASLLSDFAIMGPSGELLSSGETGEIVVRGEMIMAGYLNQPDKTSETIVDGWLHTGDLGCVDDRGFLYLRGRKREVVITGGFNVYPVDVEDVLSKHPAVDQCAVYGMPDDKWGEAVTASVQFKQGASATEAELIAYAKGQLGSVKTPKRIRFHPSLPHTAVGKVDKEALKRMSDEVPV